MVAWARLAGVAVGALVAYHARGAARDLTAGRRLTAERPRDPPQLRECPRVTVLVAAWNEAGRIERHVGSVLALGYPNLEYVLAAGGADGTFERAQALVGARGSVVRQEPGEGKQAALQRALAHVTGDVVYLTDADCIVSDEAITRLLERLEAGYGAASGRSRPYRADLLARPAILAQWSPQYVAESRHGDTSPGLLGRNCAVRRDALRAAGDMGEPVPTGTDYHLALSLRHQGVDIAFARWSFVSTSTPGTVGAYVRQQSRWMRNLWIHGSRHGDARQRDHALVSWATALVTLAMPLGTVAFGRLVLWLWALLLLHGSLGRVRYVLFTATAEELPLSPTALLACPLWFVVDAVARVRSLYDLFSEAGRTRW